MLGTLIGIASSMVTGPMTKPDTNRPLPQDSEEYWIKEYGPDLGPKAYQMWLEELGRL